MRVNRAFLAAIVLATLVTALEAAAEHVGDQPTPEWRAGPIRYIITKSEDNEYKELKTEEDRRTFIENFWRRRDPTPDTPGNEYRASFWKRVREANSQFGRDNPRPGWRSDMGKIFILFGAADEIKRDEVAEGHRGIIVWTYRNSPQIGGHSSEAGPNMVFAFAQDDTGEYRLSTEPSKLASVWEGLPDPQPPMGPQKFELIKQKALLDAFSRQIGLTDPVIREAGGPAIESPLGLAMILGRIQQPPREWTLRGEVTTRQFFGALPFKARADFFKTTGSETQTLFTVAIKSVAATYRETSAGARPALRIYTRILDSTASQQVRSLEHEDDFAPAPGNDTAGLDDDLVYQGRVLLAPGSYVARVTVLDEVSGRTGTSDTAFTVPDFAAGGFELSSLTVASVLEPAPQIKAGAYAPFVLGGFRIIPRLGQDLAQDQDLTIYYQVYGASPDPSTAKPKLNVAYIFMAPQGEKLAEIGRVTFENQTTEVHGYALPLKEWPAGDYLLRVEITDAVSSASITRDLYFRVTGKS